MNRKLSTILRRIQVHVNKMVRDHSYGSISGKQLIDLQEMVEDAIESAKE